MTKKDVIQKKFIVELKQQFTATIHKVEKKYLAECCEVNTIAIGNTTKEAIENLKLITKIFLTRHR